MTNKVKLPIDYLIQQIEDNIDVYGVEVLSKDMTLEEIKKENEILRLINEGKARVSISTLLQSWIEKLQLEETEYYQKFCKGWRNNLHLKTANYLRENYAESLKNIWVENLKRGSNN